MNLLSRFPRIGEFMLIVETMRTTPVFFATLILASAVWGAASSFAQTTGVTPDMVQTGSDLPAKWEEPHPGYDYEKREVMIPMRDGVKLHTVILVPNGAKGLPMLLERTPYNASGFISDKPMMPRCDLVGAQCEVRPTTGTSWWARISAANMARRGIT